MPNPRAHIDALVASGHTVADLEAALGLSAGYLSKVRHGAVRPSAQLVALLAVLHEHPETLPTIEGVTHRAGRPPPLRPKPAPDAIATLVALVPAMEAAGVRWALAGSAALRAHRAEAAVGSGVDIVVADADRHVLKLFRDAGLSLQHHPPGLAICPLDPRAPNDGIRIHFPTLPPLDAAWSRAQMRSLRDVTVPVVDLVTLAVANLLSHRSGAAENAAAALGAGASRRAVQHHLRTLAVLPEPKSPYVRRDFDRALAQKRLGRKR